MRDALAIFSIIQSESEICRKINKIFHEIIYSPYILSDYFPDVYFANTNHDKNIF